MDAMVCSWVCSLTFCVFHVIVCTTVDLVVSVRCFQVDDETSMLVVVTSSGLRMARLELQVSLPLFLALSPQNISTLIPDLINIILIHGDIHMNPHTHIFIQYTDICIHAYTAFGHSVCVRERERALRAQRGSAY